MIGGNFSEFPPKGKLTKLYLEMKHSIFSYVYTPYGVCVYSQVKGIDVIGKFITYEVEDLSEYWIGCLVNRVDTLPQTKIIHY